MLRPKRLVFVVTEDWYFVSHRLSLALEARNRGYDVFVITRCSEAFQALVDAGVTVVPFNFRRRSLNPLVFIREFIQLLLLYKRIKPDILHHIALRPVLVGAISARLCGIKNVVSAITGFGFLFSINNKSKFVRHLIVKTIPFLLSRGTTIVQNTDDQSFLVQSGMPRSRLRLLPGTGVDLSRYKVQCSNSSPPIVMLAARLLREKGVYEFVESASIVRPQVSVRFVLVGSLDPDNPGSLKAEEIQDLVASGLVEWWGYRTNLEHSLAIASIVCLPSYGEGFPLVLLESMALAKPCVVTDVPGCRDAVEHGCNGIVVPPRDPCALASGIMFLLNNPDEQQRMGAAGRQRVEERFNQRDVLKKTFDVYSDIFMSTQAQTISFNHFT
jgi:glycosyltransferase involved in cell wall biosynthesis